MRGQGNHGVCPYNTSVWRCFIGMPNPFLGALFVLLVVVLAGVIPTWLRTRSALRANYAQPVSYRWLEEPPLPPGEKSEALRQELEGLGYRELGRVPGYYQGVEPAIRMARDVRAGSGTIPGLPQISP